MRWELRARERRREGPLRQTVRVMGRGIGVTDLVFHDGRCVEAPFRLSAALGKTDVQIGDYCKRRGWKTEVLS